MKGYSLPDKLDEEILRLEELIDKYRKGEISATELKAYRVPFGVYEQREPDTYMVRIRCAAGIVTPSQLNAVASIAERYGVKDIHITSRQELQIHYVKLDDIVAVIKAVLAIGLATRGGGGNTVRNIAAQEDAGIDPREEFDVTPYALALTTRLIAESDSWNLPRKFKIAFSGSAEDKGYATIADVGFIARVVDGNKGFRVYVAGGLGAKSRAGSKLLDFIQEDEVYAAAKAVKNIFFKYGNRKNKHAARLRFLWQDMGEEEFRKRFQEEYQKIKTADYKPLILDLEEDRTASLSIAREDPRDADGFNLWKKRAVKPQIQKGFFSVVIPIELGFISTERASALARFIAPFGDDTVRMTKDQNFFIRNIPEKYLGNVYNFLKDNLAGFDRPAIFGRLLSCAGASTCQIGICLSRQAAKAVIRELAKAGDLDLDAIGDIRLNISGCPNSCGQHPVADLGFFGKAMRKDEHMYPAYNVVAGAVIGDGITKLAGQIGEIAAKNMPAFIKDLIGAYLSKAGRRLDIRRFIAGAGKEVIKELCVRYGEVPAFDEDKNFYFDWGQGKLFSMADRRSGECSAGLFDLIEMDLKNIRDTRRKLDGSLESRSGKAKLLGELALYSARMLLAARGVEPRSEDEVYAAFMEHFIETGLVDRSYKEVIAIVRRHDQKAIVENENVVLALAAAVESLYDSMDNSFNFRKDGVVQDSAKAHKAPVPVKDLRGVACPMNFVKTKVELSKLKPGDLLEIWLDDGPPIENVPGSIRQEGHRVISQEKAGGYWAVIIEKKKE